MGGKKMSAAEFWVVVGIVVVIALYAIWKSSQAESNDFSVMVGRAATLENEVKNLVKKNKELEDIVAGHNTSIETLAKTVEGFEKDVAECHDHNAKVTEQMLALREKIASKYPIIKIQGAIPIEYFTNPKSFPQGERTVAKPVDAGKRPAGTDKILKKTKKQIEELSK